MYVLESGAVDRFISKDGNAAVLVSTLGPHTSFGMSAFMYNMPRSSTVRTDAPTPRPVSSLPAARQSLRGLTRGRA